MTLKAGTTDIEQDISGHRTRLGLFERGDAKYGGVAPSARISSWSSEDISATITKDYYWPEGVKPSDIYRDGDKLLIKDRTQLNQGTYGTSNELTIKPGGIVDDDWESSGTATIAFTQSPNLLPASGDVIVPSGYDSHSSSTTMLDAFVYLADDDNHLGVQNHDAFKYSY